MRAQAGSKVILQHCLLAILSVDTVGFGQAISRVPNEIAVLIPTFGGDQAPAACMSSISFLKLWSSLRGGGGNYRGRAEWAPTELDRPTFESAERAGSGAKANLVYWGAAWRVGDDLVSKSFLALPKNAHARPVAHEFWRYSINVRNLRLSGKVEVPKRRYEFPSVVFPIEYVNKYPSARSIPLYKEKELVNVAGELGEQTFTPIELRSEAASIRLADGRRAWIPLPEISKANESAFTFVSAVQNVFRGNYKEATEMLSGLVQRFDVPATMKYDCLLWLCVCYGNLGSDTLPSSSAALTLNPSGVGAIRYHLFGLALAVARDGKGGAAKLREYEKFSEDRKSIISVNSGDPVLGAAQEIMIRFKELNEPPSGEMRKN